MFFFKSATEKASAETVEYDVGKAVHPESTDFAALRELERQRSKWATFLAGKPNIWSEEWLWSNRKRKPEKDGPIKKKIMYLFSTKVKLRKQMKKLIRGGVPPELRGQVWWACCGADNRMNAALPVDKYPYLVSQLPLLHKTQMAADIEKDLLRTFPERIRPEEVEFVDQLRRVLLAYALRNPKIGYCQSMNYICALLLFHMEEERAFWVFTTVVEDILPKDYYTPSLLGGRVDQQVFQSCIAWKLPKVYDIFRATNTLLEPIICPWFLCLYINVLPLYTVCRVWDCLFWEGNIVLFRIGLTLMTSKAHLIEQSDDFISIYTVLKSSNNKEYSFELESADATNATNSASLFMPSISATSPSPTASSISIPDEPQSPGGQPTMSDTEFLIYSSFGFRWLKSIPTAQVESMRSKFLVLLSEENSKVNLSRSAKEDARTRSNGHDDSHEGANASSPEKQSKNARHRGSVLMMKLLEEVDAKTLHEIALQMDEGLGEHVQALAKELENNDTRTTDGTLTTIDGDDSQLIGEDDDDDDDEEDH